MNNPNDAFENGLHFSSHEKPSIIVSPSRDRNDTYYAKEDFNNNARSVKHQDDYDNFSNHNSVGLSRFDTF